MRLNALPHGICSDNNVPRYQTKKHILLQMTDHIIIDADRQNRHERANKQILMADQEFVLGWNGSTTD